MSIIQHVQNKAQKVGLDLRATLGTDYILVLPIYLYSAMKNAEFKGSLYQCNWMINRLIEKNVTVQVNK